MAEVDIKVNLLVIAMMGIALFIAATGLYLVAHRISDYGHLLLPLPAIAVAAYILWSIGRRVAMRSRCGMHRWPPSFGTYSSRPSWAASPSSPLPS